MAIQPVPPTFSIQYLILRSSSVCSETSLVRIAKHYLLVATSPMPIKPLATKALLLGLAIDHFATGTESE
jgi:hypothetical protein